MGSLTKGLREYRELLQKTDLQHAYKGLIQYMLVLQKHFKERHPEYEVSDHFYQGYMDLTFFSLVSDQAKQKALKYMVVFNHEKMRFEVWLSGRNRAVMSEYHQKLRSQPMGNYRLTADEKGMAAIIVAVLVEEPNFDDPLELTALLDKGVSHFIQEIENRFLSEG